jgi:hypothetical protein
MYTFSVAKSLKHFTIYTAHWTTLYTGTIIPAVAMIAIIFRCSKKVAESGMLSVGCIAHRIGYTVTQLQEGLTCVLRAFPGVALETDAPVRHTS